MPSNFYAHKNYTKNPDVEKFAAHTHEAYEIFCFLSGDAKYYVEGNIYDLKEGDILLIKKAETHSLLINSNVPYERYVVVFRADDLLGEYAKSLLQVVDKKPLGKYNKIFFKDKKPILYLLEQITSVESVEEKRVYLTVLLNEICKNLYLNKSEELNIVKDIEIIEYINQNLMKISGIEEICSRFFISSAQLSRKFKAMTGSTVWNYIVTKRLLVAKELLSQGIMPHTASEICGYEEYSSFYRAYKCHFGSSPKDDCIRQTKSEQK